MGEGWARGKARSPNPLLPWLATHQAQAALLPCQVAMSLSRLLQEQGQQLQKTMLELEKQGLEAMEELLNSSSPLDPAEVGDLFYDCVDTEIKFFK